MEVKHAVYDVELATLKTSHPESATSPIESSPSGDLPITWTYSKLKQLTAKSLVEVLFDECRSGWWLLVLTGMVWGNENMWKRLRDSTWTWHADGHWQYASTNSPANSPTETSPIIARISFPASWKKIVIRVWFVLVHLVVFAGIVLVSFFMLYQALGYVSLKSNRYQYQLVCFYLTMLIQAVTTLVTTRLMYIRVHSFAPQYTVAFYRKTVPHCLAFLALAISMELMTIADAQPAAFVIGFSNFTLLACLMFILVDIQSSSYLVDHLLGKLEHFRAQMTARNNSTVDEEETVRLNASNPLLAMHTAKEEIVTTSQTVIDLHEYDLLRTEILQRVNESWYINTFSVSVAVLNVLMLCLGSFSFLRSFSPLSIAVIVFQLGKEVVFLFVVFVYCATMNAKVEVFMKTLGNCLSWYEQPLHLWVYANLNPISFKLGGYVVTWNRIALQLLSIAVGVVIGFIKTTILSA